MLKRDSEACVRIAYVYPQALRDIAKGLDSKLVTAKRHVPKASITIFIC